VLKVDEPSPPPNTALVEDEEPAKAVDCTVKLPKLVALPTDAIVT
jgi:hypothetical protein